MQLPHWQNRKCWQVMKYVISTWDHRVHHSLLWCGMISWVQGTERERGWRGGEMSKNQRECKYFPIRNISAACTCTYLCTVHLGGSPAGLTVVYLFNCLRPGLLIWGHYIFAFLNHETSFFLTFDPLALFKGTARPAPSQGKNKATIFIAKITSSTKTKFSYYTY